MKKANIIGASMVGLAMALTVPLAAFAQAAPTITSISPTSASVGSGDTIITVNGTNFQSGSTVQLKGAGLNTTYVSTTELTATIPSSDLASAGMPSVTVKNPDGSSSGTANFTVANLPNTGFGPDEEPAVNLIALIAALGAASAVLLAGFGLKKVLARS